MARRASFRKTDVVRAITAARDVGLTVTRVEIDGGKLTLHTDQSAAHQQNALDQWASRNGLTEQWKPLNGKS